MTTDKAELVAAHGAYATLRHLERLARPNNRGAAVSVSDATEE